MPSSTGPHQGRKGDWIEAGGKDKGGRFDSDFCGETVGLVEMTMRLGGRGWRQLHQPGSSFRDGEHKGAARDRKESPEEAELGSSESDGDDRKKIRES
jgi:hypothetical protein